MPAAESRLKAFYDLRATEEPESDPEALLRFRKAADAAKLRAGERVLDVGAKRGGVRIDRRLGTSLRLPKTARLIPTNSILARSRLYVLRPVASVVLAGRGLSR
jgi:hypothetical protein